MPRTKVPPGRSSKRFCSRALICRGANLRLWATSAIESPCASRAALRLTPTGSVKLASLQRLVFGRVREAPAQLVGIALLGRALATLALYAQGQPQRFGARRHELVIARNKAPRLVNISLSVANLRKLYERRRILRVGLERSL